MTNCELMGDLLILDGIVDLKMNKAGDDISVPKYFITVDDTSEILLNKYIVSGKMF